MKKLLSILFLSFSLFLNAQDCNNLEVSYFEMNQGCPINDLLDIIAQGTPNANVDVAIEVTDINFNTEIFNESIILDQSGFGFISISIFMYSLIDIISINIYTNSIS